MGGFINANANIIHVWVRLSLCVPTDFGYEDNLFFIQLGKCGKPYNLWL